MTKIVETIYNSLHPSAKNLLATVKGYHLLWLRYGKLYRSLLTGIKKREEMDLKTIEKYQNNEFIKLYSHAMKNVPYYIDRSQKYPANVNSLNSLHDLPIITKQELIENNGSMVDRRKNKLFLEKVHTSGTTGTPLKVYFSREDNQRRYAYFEMRVTRWGGITPGNSFARIGGNLIIPFDQKKPPFWVWNSALNQLYMSSYHLSEDYVRYYLEELRKRKLTYIIGYASSLYSLAYYAKELGVNDIFLKTAFSNAEPFYAHQRELIEKVFHCRTHDHYGTSEFVCLASECREKNMHISPEVGIIEVLDDFDNPVNEGEVGNLVLTGLTNFTMPLFRYKIGDVGSISCDKCSCGCQFPLIKQIEGRNDDLLITKDGRRIGRLDPVFKADLEIIEAQIIQESLEKIRVKVVPGKKFNKEKEFAIVKRLKDRIGEFDVEIDLVDEIERTKRGKFRAVINQMSNDYN